MDTHETATLGEFAELAGSIMRALPKAIVGLNIRETLELADTNNEQLSGFLREVLTSLNKPTQDQKAEEPIALMPPTEFTINGRDYELVPILKKGESLVTSDTIVERAKMLNANLGEEDGAFILKHQNEIPQEFRGKFYLVFTAWRHSSHPQNVAYLYWDDDRWHMNWTGVDYAWVGDARLVRRCPSTSSA